MKDSEAQVQDNVQNLDLNVQVKTYKPNDKDIENYLKVKNEGKTTTLNHYLQETYFKNENTAIIADLSNMEFNNQGAHDENNKPKLINLKGADFSGSIIKDTKFIGCDLEGAIFRDTDLNNAKFENTKIKNMDFRGADLANCNFVGYKLQQDLGNKEQENYLGGIKYSTTVALGRAYADIKGDLVRKAEQGQTKVLTNREADLLNNKEKEVTEAQKTLSLTENTWYQVGKKTGNAKYDKLSAELKQMQEGKFEAPEKVMNSSFKEVFSSNNDFFDPAYTRGTTAQEANIKKEYVALNREDIENYLSKIKEDPKLTINDFAKAKLGQSKEIPEGTVIVADCSSKGDLSNQIQRLDLSGLDFTNANLSGAVFAGSNLSGCNFTNADISKSSFEGVVFGKDPQAIYEKGKEIKPAIFHNTKAQDANFFGANVEAAQITDSDFKRSYMSKSNAVGAKIEGVNFDYANIKDGKWDQVKVKEASFNFANLEGISLANADIQRTQAQHVILNKAVLDNCKIIESDFTKAYMSEVSATKAQINNTILQEITAQKINLSEAELKGFTTLEGADLDKAIMTKINAERINFANAKMNEIDATFANLTESNLKNVEAKFANLDNAVLDKVKASGIDMTGGKLNEAKAHGANFTKATLCGTEAIKADFLKSDFSEADLKDTNLKKAILEQVNLEKTKVNANTNLAGANTKDTKGTLENYDHQNNNTGKIAIEEQQKKSETIENSKNAPWYKKLGGKILSGMASVGENLRDYVGKVKEMAGNFVSKYGKVAGAIVGAVVIAGIVGAAVASGGASLVVMAGAVVGAAVVGAAVGTGVAHYATKKPGTLIGAAIGAATLPVAPVLGVGAGLLIGHTVLDPAMEKIGQIVKDGYQEGITRLESGAEKLGNSPAITSLLNEHDKCQEKNNEHLNDVKQKLSNNVADEKLPIKQAENKIASKNGIQVPKLDKMLSEAKEQAQFSKSKDQGIAQITENIKKSLVVSNNKPAPKSTPNRKSNEVKGPAI